ncbi:MAG: hypothetical protein V4636_13095 [Pseudomonadota bacterium]
MRPTPLQIRKRRCDQARRYVAARPSEQSLAPLVRLIAAADRALAGLPSPILGSDPMTGRPSLAPDGSIAIPPELASLIATEHLVVRAWRDARRSIAKELIPEPPLVTAEIEPVGTGIPEEYLADAEPIW